MYIKYKCDVYKVVMMGQYHFSVTIFIEGKLAFIIKAVGIQPTLPKSSDIFPFKSP